jgi:hypothetical protein
MHITSTTREFDFLQCIADKYSHNCCLDANDFRSLLYGSNEDDNNMVAVGGVGIFRASFLKNGLVHTQSCRRTVSKIVG